MALRPVEFHLDGGEIIAGVESTDHLGHFTIVLLHQVGADLDMMLPILGQVGMCEVRKVAIDLPGHGLSSGAFDPRRAGEVLGELRQSMRARGWAPFLFVAAGSTAPYALRLAAAPDTLGLCLVSPRTGGLDVDREVPRCPILAFVSSAEDAASAEWLAIRSRLRSWWMAVSIAVGHDALLAGEGSAGSQIASHLQGFARDMYATSPLLAGRIGPAARPKLAG